jgi:chemotaxis protein methyltransferase CheR
MIATSDEIDRFAAGVAARLGLRVDRERASELIERRAAEHGQSIAAYLDRFDGDPQELCAVTSELTIGETYFLRHIEQFRAFSDAVVAERTARGRLRVLSAACSSGEEPYTLAMLLRESWPAVAFEIHAIDLDPRAIARARAGRYSRWSLRAVAPGFEQRWFRPDGRDLVVVPEIRAAVTFEQANLVDASALANPSRWDVVFCRNVMMYFTEARADALISQLSRALAPAGYLFLGHAETLRGRTDEFALCHTHGAFYYQRLPASTVDVGTARPVATMDGDGDREPVLELGWHEDIRAATERVHAMVDVALDNTASRASDRAAALLVSPPPVVREEAVETVPDLREIRELLEQERFGKALERLDHLRAICAVHHDVAILRALVLTHSGRFAEARATCAELLALDDTSAGANYLLALCCDSTGDTAGAAHRAQLAADLDPSFAMPRVHLGLLARRGGDRAIASRELGRAIALLEAEAPARLALYGGGFSRQALLGMCRAELAAIGAPR